MGRFVETLAILSISCFNKNQFLYPILKFNSKLNQKNSQKIKK